MISILSRRFYIFCWRHITDCLEDSVLADVTKFEPSPEATEPLVLYYDETRLPGKKYFYRVKGLNNAGSTDYSNILEIK